MSTNSCSSSINSTRSNSLWRRILYSILPHLDNEEEIQELIRRTSIDVSTENNTTWQQLSTAKSYDQPIKKGVIFINKPLPPLPKDVPPYMKPKKSVQFLDIRPEVEGFIREVDTGFLSPLGRKALQHLNRLSGPPQSPGRKTVKFGTTYLNVPTSDADCLSELRGMTTNMPLEHKRKLLQDLAHLVKPECKSPLRQIMLQRVQMGDTEPVVKMSDHESEAFAHAPVLEEEDTPEQLREVLTPPPLRIKWKGEQNAVHRARSLSPLAEHSDAINSTHMNQPTGGPTPSKLPGSVRAARLAAEAQLAERGRRPGPRYGAIRSTTSTPSLRSRRMWQSTLATIPSEEDFINPRQAPNPPFSPAQGELGDAVSVAVVQPSNVADADITSIARSRLARSHAPSVSSSHSIGSIRAVKNFPTAKLKGQGRARSLMVR